MSEGFNILDLCMLTSHQRVTGPVAYTMEMALAIAFDLYAWMKHIAHESLRQ